MKTNCPWAVSPKYSLPTFFTPFFTFVTVKANLPSRYSRPMPFAGFAGLLSPAVPSADADAGAGGGGGPSGVETGGGRPDVTAGSDGPLVAAIAPHDTIRNRAATPPRAPYRHPLPLCCGGGAANGGIGGGGGGGGGPGRWWGGEGPYWFMSLPGKVGRGGGGGAGGEAAGAVRRGQERL